MIVVYYHRAASSELVLLNILLELCKPTTAIKIQRALSKRPTFNM